MLCAFFISHFSFLISTATAQPRVTRAQQQQRQQQSQQQQAQQAGVTQRMQIQYPTALDMPEDVVWRRDIYREINLNDDENAGLYDPVEPQGRRLNLFT